MLKTLSPREAADLVAQGAVLVDIREADEHACGHVPGSALHPLSRLDRDAPAAPPAGKIIFYCRTGNRTKCNEAVLAKAAKCDAWLLEGGLDAWRAAGLPVASGRAA